MTNYKVSPHDEGWGVKRDGAAKNSSIHATQADAVKTAKGYSANNGGGDVSVAGRNGRIRAKDTVKPGNDPRHITG